MVSSGTPPPPPAPAAMSFFWGGAIANLDCFALRMQTYDVFVFSVMRGRGANAKACSPTLHENLDSVHRIEVHES